MSEVKDSVKGLDTVTFALPKSAEKLKCHATLAQRVSQVNEIVREKFNRALQHESTQELQDLKDWLGGVMKQFSGYAQEECNVLLEHQNGYGHEKQPKFYWASHAQLKGNDHQYLAADLAKKFQMFRAGILNQIDAEMQRLRMPDIKFSSELSDLRQALKHAEEKEDYERASKLKDEIAKLREGESQE